MYRFIPIMLLCVCLFTGGCSQNKDQPSATHNQTPATEAASHTDHTPQVLTPQADGTKTFTTDTAVIDISHTQEGYIMAKYTGFNAKPKLQLTGTDGITYTYSLYKDYSTFPLTSGDGTYQVGVYENVSDDRYTTLLSETFSVTLTDPLKPYLYPNQYVNFTADFLPVAKAEELADGASSDLDIISSVYNYIITHTTRTLLHISTILNHYMLGFIIAFLVLLIICMILYHTDLGRVLFLGQKLAMTVASGRVANCLYLVLSSGLDSNIGLTLARELVNNPHMQALIDKCHENIRRGIIRQSTAAVRHLFPDVRQLDCNRFPDRRNGKHCFPAGDQYRYRKLSDGTSCCIAPDQRYYLHFCRRKYDRHGQQHLTAL